MVTSDGVTRVDDGFDWTVTSYSGGSGGAVLGVVSGSEYSFSGSYQVDALIPDGTDTVVFAPVLAGVAPIVFTGLTPGSNARAAALITDPYRSVTVTGSVTEDGEQPASGVQVDLTGYRRGDDRLEAVWSDYFSGSPFTGSDGSIQLDLSRVAPEVDVLELAVTVFGAEGLRVHYRYLDLVGPGPLTLDVDIEQSSNRLAVYGLAEIDGVCASAGQSFGFVMTVLGYSGVDDATPVLLSQGQVISTVSITSGDVRDWHWTANVPVPHGITHVQANYTTVDALDPNGAQLDVVGDLVAYPGGLLEIDESLVAACAP
jgi:hypothetical protein